LAIFDVLTVNFTGEAEVFEGKANIDGYLLLEILDE
jgi:hypothetical protein